MLSSALFFIGALPLSVYAGLSDLRTMTIPNWISIALIAIFIILGLFLLPFETLAWRLGAGFAVLVVGFFLNAARVLGGGDAKFLAAITPYIAFDDVAAFMFILSVSLLVTLALHRLAMRIPAIRRVTAGWASWEAGRHFPMGISIAAAIVVYLFLKVLNLG